MAHNKYITFLFLVWNDPILVKPGSQVLRLNLAKDFFLSNFLITGLCNFPASCSFTIMPDHVFLSKIYLTVFAIAH